MRILEHECSNGQLLDLYLSLSGSQRNQRFADTARAAIIAGTSQRTIQLWIEMGMIRAVRIGRKFQVDLDSMIDYLRKTSDDY